jgi:nicotinate phosphoribosyltransferase
MKQTLPQTHEGFADKYFLRANEILKAEELNPWVRAQVFIRKGPGKVYGIDEALNILDTYSPLVENGGKVYSLREGDKYNPKDTLMVIEAPIQDIVELETMYLGVLAAETTKANDNHEVNLNQVKENMRKVVEAAEGKPVSYFGARHWRFDEDAAIARAAYEGGATSASTDVGAATFNEKGIGTIPHALENIMAWKYGYENAVVESTKAFNKVIDPRVPRIALIDYANKEVDDSVATARALEGRLSAVRIDTCGENLAQGSVKGDRKYWEGNGVTITGTKAVRDGLDNAGYEDVKIVLTSGFGKVEKVKAFIEAEKQCGRLFDSLGVGGIYEARMSTMDIVAVGDNPFNLTPMAKVGREYRPNPNLELRLGGRK